MQSIEIASQESSDEFFRSVDCFHDWDLVELRGVNAFLVGFPESEIANEDWTVAVRFASEAEGEEVTLVLTGVDTLILGPAPTPVDKCSLSIQLSPRQRVRLNVDGCSIEGRRVFYSRDRFTRAWSLGPEPAFGASHVVGRLAESNEILCPNCAHVWAPRWLVERCPQCGDFCDVSTKAFEQGASVGERK